MESDIGQGPANARQRFEFLSHPDTPSLLTSELGACPVIAFSRYSIDDLAPPERLKGICSLIGQSTEKVPTEVGDELPRGKDIAACFLRIYCGHFLPLDVQRGFAELGKVS